MRREKVKERPKGRLLRRCGCLLKEDFRLNAQALGLTGLFAGLGMSSTAVADTLSMLPF